MVTVGGHRWSKEEAQIILEFYSYKKAEELKTMLPNRSIRATSSYAKRLKIKKSREFKKMILEKMWEKARNPRTWTKEEIEVLRENYENKTYEELKKLLPDKTIHSVCFKANTFGLFKNKEVIAKYRRRIVRKKWRNMWRKEELRIIEEKYADTPNSELLKILDRPIKSIWAKARELGLRKTKRWMGRKRSSLCWTDQEIELLKEVYPVGIKENILESFPKRSWRGIQNNAMVLGIKRNRSIIEKRLISKGEFNPASWTQKKPTNPEQILTKIIKKHKFPFEYVGNKTFMIGSLTPDFVYKNKIIEVFGRAFHDPKVTFKKKIPLYQQYEGRRAYFNEYGYKCLILWDDELSNEDVVVSRIKNYMGDRW